MAVQHPSTSNARTTTPLGGKGLKPPAPVALCSFLDWLGRDRATPLWCNCARAWAVGTSLGSAHGPGWVQDRIRPCEGPRIWHGPGTARQGQPGSSASFPRSCRRPDVPQEQMGWKQADRDLLQIHVSLATWPEWPFLIWSSSVEAHFTFTACEAWKNPTLCFCHTCVIHSKRSSCPFSVTALPSAGVEKS